MKLALQFPATQWLLALGQLLSAVPLLLMSSGALAANLEEAANAPVEVVSIWFVVLFFILFFGMIVGFFAYLWRIEKNKKQGR